MEFDRKLRTCMSSSTIYQLLTEIWHEQLLVVVKRWVMSGFSIAVLNCSDDELTVTGSK